MLEEKIVQKAVIIRRPQHVQATLICSAKCCKCKKKFKPVKEHPYVLKWFEVPLGIGQLERPSNFPGETFKLTETALMKLVQTEKSWFHTRWYARFSFQHE